MAIKYARRSSTTNADRHSGSIRRRLRVASIAFLAAFQFGAFVDPVHGAKFDERIKAPPAPTNAELKAVIRDYFNTYARVNANSIAGIVRDKAAYQQWFETEWRLQRAIDAKRPLGDLSEFGLTSNRDGSYSVDLSKYPQWEPLPTRLDRFREPQHLRLDIEALKVRGFRDQDIEALGAYVTGSPPRNQASIAELDIADGYVARVKAQLAAKQKASASQLLSYIYQTNRISKERARAWALGLLDVLDQQRQRILESYLQEQAGNLAIGPDDIEGQLKFAVDAIASGEFERQMSVERKEARP
jgi:hypothetical protein